VTNIVENNICDAVENFKNQEQGAKILLKEVSDAERFAWRKYAEAMSSASKKT